MAEISPDDLPEAVLARFDDHDAAQASIDAVLTAARRWCGWLVSPVVTETVTLDGSGDYMIGLPTMKLVELTDVTESGEPVNLSTLHWSTPTGLRPVRGVITKKRGWWTGRIGAVSVTMTHGYTESEAADWRRAVIFVVGQRVQQESARSADMKRKKVDDVEYEWFEALVSTDRELSALFSQFRILPSP